MFYYNPADFSFHLCAGGKGCFSSLNTQGDGFSALFPHTLLPETPSRSHLDSCSLMLSAQMSVCDTMPGPSSAGFHPFLLHVMWVTKPCQRSSHLGCAVFNGGLLLKPPTFMTAAATKAWRTSSKVLHESSLHQQLLQFMPESM